MSGSGSRNGTGAASVPRGTGSTGRVYRARTKGERTSRGCVHRSDRRLRPEGLLVVGDLVLDEETGEVWRGGDRIRLTGTEFELLRFLMRNPRRVLSKAQILDRVWNYDVGRQANLVELYISYLRRKIDVGRERMIHTRRGAGYVFKPGEGVGGVGRPEDGSDTD